MDKKSHSRWVAYGVAVLATAVTLLVRSLLWPVLGDAVAHMFFFPAVMIAAYYGGFAPGFLSTILGALAANYFFTEPRYSLQFKNLNATMALPLFILVGTIISGLCELLHRARRRIVADERRRADETLRETEERFQQLAENIHEIFWIRDAQTDRLTYISPGVEILWGITPLELYANPQLWFERMHPDDRQVANESWQQRKRGEFSTLESRLVRPDGSIRWIRSRAFPISIENGTITRIAGLAEDITERKRTEEVLRAAEARFRALIDHATDAFFLIDHADGRLLDVNCQACHSLGYTRDELIGKTIYDIDPDFTPASKERLSAHFGVEDTVVLDTRHVRKDGLTFPVEVRVRSIIVDGRRCDLALVRDMTERKKIEDALRESESRWRGLTESLPQLVWSAACDGACDYFSTQWSQHTGVPESELLGWRWLETLHPDDREPTRRVWLDSVAGRSPYDVEYRVRRQDGVYRWFKTRGTPIRDRAGHICKWFGTCTDITELRQTEEALRESEERFRGTFENAAVGITHTDAAGRFLRVNQKYCEIVGFPREELLAMAIRDLTHPDDLAAALAKYNSLVLGELSSYSQEKRDIRKDGSVVWIHVSVSQQRDALGAPLHTIGIIQDISVRKRLEAELRQAKDAAEAANRAKDEFLANVSHEIRTPMNAILGMTELTLDTPLSEDQRTCLKTVKSAADSLLGIINDLLDFSKIEAGKLELDAAGFSLRAALGDTLRALAVRTHNKGLELVCHVQPDVPDALIGDAGRLRQVLLNLIGNAIKFTERGEVVVTVGLQSESSTHEPSVGNRPSEIGDLKFEVRDTGIGIPREKQETIFRAFEQEDTSTTRRFGGTGLGLSISARLVALMGGTISVESEPGRGSTFTFTAQFGLQAEQPGKVAMPPPVALHGLNVLVVDDNATNRHILTEWFRDWQMEPTAVGDGVAAMDALWHGTSNGRPYSLVILDARMPDTDGLALAAKIRDRNAFSAVRLILLTSGDRPGDAARARDVRINAHLLKPVQQGELLETIYRVMSRHSGVRDQESGVREEETRQPVSPLTRDPAPHTRSLRILVAEDNEFNSQLLEQLLVRRGHRVRLANDGRQTLSLLGIRSPESGNRSRGSGFRNQQAAENSQLTPDSRPLTPDPCPQTPEFDLLLLDVHMPEFDGFQVVEAIRESERCAGGHLPVIALTARSRKVDREHCLSAGMDDFLSKPIQVADLWAAIDRVRQNGEVGKIVEETQVAPGSVSTVIRPSLANLIDPQVVLAACGGDAVILEKICQVLQSNLPDHVTAVQNAMRNGEAPQLREAAHKLAGMVSVFSQSAGEMASSLEDHAANERLNECEPLVETLVRISSDLIRQVGGLSIETLRHQTVAAH